MVIKKRHTNWQQVRNLQCLIYASFFSCFVRKATAHVETKTLNMRHQAQKGFRGIFVGIPEHQKGYLVYVPNTRMIISSYDVVFDESFSSVLAYTRSLA